MLTQQRCTQLISLCAMMSTMGCQDSSPGTPIFVFLAPGVDVAAAVEVLGRKLGFTAAAGKYTSVSLGQVAGQTYRC